MPKRYGNQVKYLVVCCLCFMFWVDRQTRAEGDWNAGPLFDRFSLTLEPGNRTESVGPIYSRQQKNTESLLAFSPLFSRTRDPGTDAEGFDLLYPALTYDRYGMEYRWQLFQLLSLSGGHNQQEIPKTSFTIFPLYFRQTSPDPEQNYSALAPVYGTLKHRLFRDQIHFILFPLYGQTRKGDVVTDNYLYPFFHLRHGEALQGWQFWPLVGHEHKDPTSRTNGFGETEIIDGHDKLFAFWPIFSNETDGVGTDNPQRQRAVLPFYSTSRSPKRDVTSVLWPFFTIIDDREKKYREWETPWPFVVFARGEGKTTTRVLPFFGRSHNDTMESDFYLWPVYKYNRVQAGVLDRERKRILFFLYSDVNERNTETGKARTRTDLWPLFTHHRDFNGNSRLQILAPVEPVLPDNRSIERNWSPLWSVWRSEKNPETGATSQSLFWNLYRRDATPAAKKCSLLFGLFQYQSSPETKRLRLLYIPVINARRTAD